jgi:hypothetical protein
LNVPDGSLAVARAPTSEGTNAAADFARSLALNALVPSIALAVTGAERFAKNAPPIGPPVNAEPATASVAESMTSSKRYGSATVIAVLGAIASVASTPPGTHAHRDSTACTGDAYSAWRIFPVAATPSQATCGDAD